MLLKRTEFQLLGVGLWKARGIGRVAPIFCALTDGGSREEVLSPPQSLRAGVSLPLCLRSLISLPDLP